MRNTQKDLRAGLMPETPISVKTLRDDKTMGFIIYSLAALSVGFYYLTLLRYSSNAPISDDFDAVLGFLNDFISARTFNDKIALIFLQHNEHRIVLTRLFVLANYYIMNTVNFKVLIIAGNLALIGILAVIFKAHNKRSLVWFSPVVFILFEPQCFGTIFFAMAAIQNFYVLLFAFLSLYFMSKDGYKNFIAASAFAVIAAFTSGSGILSFIAGALTLFIQRKFRSLAVWLSLMLLTALAYLYGYVQPPDHSDIVKTLLARPGSAALHLIVLLGNILVYLPTLTIYIPPDASVFLPMLVMPLMMGLILTAFFAYLTIKGYYLKNPVIYSFLVFIVLSEALTAAGRCGIGIGNAVSTRYVIMSAVFCACAYIALIETTDSALIEKLFRVIVSAAVLFNIAAFYINYGKIAALHQYVEQGFLYFRTHSGNPMALQYPNQEKARKILIRSIIMGSYRL
ncbi:MAG: hypothetical protein L7F77_13400 [Candidatus Magnetominusculus sp. LBB02]|nr:hypothetical protein [Candidatus Magnetominusculus sp. LBB02]